MAIFPPSSQFQLFGGYIPAADVLNVDQPLLLFVPKLFLSRSYRVRITPPDDHPCWQNVYIPLEE
jgi:hypothetical protein